MAVMAFIILWDGWKAISNQSPVFEFQNGTNISFSIFHAEDNNNYIVAMQRTTTFDAGTYKSIMGPVSRVPSYLLLTYGDENTQYKEKVQVMSALPWPIWFKLKFMPWRYTAGFIVNILPEGELKLTWFLKDGNLKRRAIDCGGWLIDQYLPLQEKRIENYRFTEEQPRGWFLCSPLAFMGYEQSRIEEKLKGKN